MSYDGTLKFDTSLDTKDFQKSANGLGDAFGGSAVFKIFEKGFQLVVSSMDQAISRYDTLNKFPKVLESMGFNADKSAAATQKLSDGVQGLPTSLDDIVANAQRLTVLTGNLDDSVDATLALNNAFLASGASAGDASRGLTQYVQMLSSGKVDTMSWKTLTETMGYALREVASAFGYASIAAGGDFYSALQSGEITFDQFNAKLIELSNGVGGFAEMALTASGGIGTAMTNMRTRIAAGMTDIIAAIDRGLSETKFKSIENIINTMGVSAKKTLTTLAGAFEFAAKNIVPITIAVVAFAAAWKSVQLVTYIGQIGSVSAALAKMLPPQLALIAAKIQDGAVTKANILADLLYNTIMTASIVIKKLATVAENANTAATTGGIGAKIAATIATGALTVATAAWGVAVAIASLPLIAIIAIIAAVVVGIVALISWLNKSNAEYKKQKEEVKALSEAQEQLADSAKSSEDAYKSNRDAMIANTKVAQDYVGRLKSVQASTDSTENKQRDMAETVKLLNATVDGLNIAYDKETGKLTSLNTGQEISIEQLEELVQAKADVARANAWQERANELIREQIKIEENLAVIEEDKKAIMEDANLTTSQQNSLIRNLDKTANAHAETMADVQQRLEVVNTELEASNTEMAESIVSDYDRMASAVTESGETIAQVATQWGVSVDEILAVMEAENISLDQWVANQESAWADFECAVKEKTSGVINSFKEIPGEYDKSAAEMLTTLQNNKARYAEWETAMEDITRELGPSAAAEFAKLGPEATSAMQEILGSTEMLKEYRDLFGVELDGVTGAAIEDWNDPAFIGAPSDAIDSSAQMITANTALADSMATQMEGAKTAAEAVDFTDVGQGIATSIVSGLNSADVSGAMSGIATAIQNSAGAIKSSVDSISTTVQNTFKTMATQAQSTATQMMTQINSTIISRTGTIKASITSMSNGITTALNSCKTQAVNIVSNMMTSMSSAMSSGASTITATASSISSGVVNNLQPMISGGTQAASNLMSGMYNAMDAGAGSLYAKANQIATTISATLKAAWDEHSPSKVSYQIMEYFMIAMYNAMGDLAGKLYGAAESIADGLTERLTIAPEPLRAVVDSLRAMTEANPLGGSALTPIGAMGVSGGTVVYQTNLNQKITTPKPLSPSEITREGQDLLRRNKFQLP